MGNQKFNSGVYPEPDYERIRRANPSVFPFTFGSDKMVTNHAYIIGGDTNCRLVIRLGVFIPPGHADVTVEIISPAT